MRTIWSILAVTLTVAALVAPPPAGAAAPEPVYPVMAGVNRIVAEGTAAVTLWVPEQGHIAGGIAGDLNLVLRGATAAHAAIVVRDCDRTAPSGAKWQWCPDFKVIRVAEFTRIPQTGSAFQTTPPNLPAGLVDVYLVADGPVTLEARVHGLDGELDVAATGAATGTIARLPTRCHDWAGDCTHQGFGGATEDVGDLGLVTVYAYAQTPVWLYPGSGISNVGSRTAIACIYSDADEDHGSADPDDHPTGCHYDPAESSHSHSMFRNYWLNATPVMGPSNAFWVSQGIARGPVCAGGPGTSTRPTTA